jgi:hypothetical protein
MYRPVYKEDEFHLGSTTSTLACVYPYSVAGDDVKLDVILISTLAVDSLGAY